MIVYIRFTYLSRFQTVPHETSLSIDEQMYATKAKKYFRENMSAKRPEFRVIHITLKYTPEKKILRAMYLDYGKAFEQYTTKFIEYILIIIIQQYHF